MMVIFGLGLPSLVVIITLVLVTDQAHVILATHMFGFILARINCQVITTTPASFGMLPRRAALTPLAKAWA